MSICAFSGTRGVHCGTPSPAGKQTGISGPTFVYPAHFANRIIPVSRPPTLTWIVQQQDCVIMNLRLEVANTVNEFNHILNTRTETNKAHDLWLTKSQDHCHKLAGHKNIRFKVDQSSSNK
jgi:hypothetical protein